MREEPPEDLVRERLADRRREAQRLLHANDPARDDRAEVACEERQEEDAD